MSFFSDRADKSTVVICTRNRPASLKKCLDSLKKLSPSPLEIILVNNDAPGSFQTSRVAAQYPFLRVIREPRPGLSVARNTGINNARGEIILFTDDDAQAHPHWAGQLQKNFENQDIMAVTGLVLPAGLNTKAQVIFENDLGGFARGNRPKIFDPALFKQIKNWGFPAWEMGGRGQHGFSPGNFYESGAF